MRRLPFLRWILLGAALAAPLLRPVMAIADVIVTEWDLRASVFDSPNVVQNVAGTNQLQNPFASQFLASIPPSSASATYQVSWNASSVFFILNTALHAESLEGSVNTFGHLNVIPSVDSILTLDGSYIYNMPTQPARAAFAISVSKTNPSQSLYSNSQTRTNFAGPPSGTLLVNDQILLPAGQSWRIQWGFAIDHFDDAIPGAASDATGHLAFQIHPVPEPATLSLLLLATLTTRRPSRHG